MKVDGFLKEHEVYDFTAADSNRIGKHSANSERSSTLSLLCDSWRLDCKESPTHSPIETVRNEGTVVRRQPAQTSVALDSRLC